MWKQIDFQNQIYPSFVGITRLNMKFIKHFVENFKASYSFSKKFCIFLSFLLTLSFLSVEQVKPIHKHNLGLLPLDYRINQPYNLGFLSTH